MNTIQVEAYHIYTGSACSGNPGPAGCGVVIRKVRDGSELHMWGTMPGNRNTNHQAEMTAIAQALESLGKDGCGAVVGVYTRNAYISGCYANKNWKRKVNGALWLRMSSAFALHEVAFVEHVKAGEDSPFNDQATALARVALAASIAQTYAGETAGKIWARNPKLDAKAVEAIAVNG